MDELKQEDQGTDDETGNEDTQDHTGSQGKLKNPTFAVTAGERRKQREEAARKKLQKDAYNNV